MPVRLGPFYLAYPIRSIETRSLPTLTRSYPRRFTFYLAHPIRSILTSCFLLPLIPAVAVRKSERANSGVPVVRVASRGIVGPCVPECAIITRIDRHLAVISEPDVVQLNATAVDQC